MKKTIIIPILLLMISVSCLKKIEGTENLNTNIFDKDYAGGVWFYIDDVSSYYTDFGQLKIRVDAVLPSANMPALKPYLIYINCSVNNKPETLFYSYKDTDGDYPFYFDLSPESSGEYCMDAGIYLEDEDTTINRFTLCSEL